MKRSLLALAPTLLLAACGPKPEGEAVTTLEFGEDGTKIVRNDGDNGTQGDVVSPPFDPTKAKMTFYEGGIKVPMVVAGPGIKKPGRRTEKLQVRGAQR